MSHCNIFSFCRLFRNLCFCSAPSLLSSGRRAKRRAKGATLRSLGGCQLIRIISDVKKSWKEAFFKVWTQDKTWSLTWGRLRPQPQSDLWGRLRLPPQIPSLSHFSNVVFSEALSKALGLRSKKGKCLFLSGFSIFGVPLNQMFKWNPTFAFAILLEEMQTFFISMYAGFFYVFQSSVR